MQKFYVEGREKICGIESYKLVFTRTLMIARSNRKFDLEYVITNHSFAAINRTLINNLFSLWSYLCRINLSNNTTWRTWCIQTEMCDVTMLSADPPENSHLTVQKMAKNLTFFQNNCQKFSFFQKKNGNGNFFEKIKISGNFLGKMSSFWPFFDS